MELYLEKLVNEENLYLKRTFYDKLDAIREKIALRTISKFLMPYVIMKFGPRRQKKLTKKTKTKRKNK